MISQSTRIPLEVGTFRISYHRFEQGACLSIAYGNVKAGIPLVRIHSSCLFGESLHGLDCDCAAQLDGTLKLIKEHGKGVIVYQFAEGRGIGLEEKIRALELQRTRGIDTVEAFRVMGLPPDLRSYDIPVKALEDLGVSKEIIFASQNPVKLAAVQEAGFLVRERRYPKVKITKYNKPELLVKKYKLGHDIDI